MANVVITGSTKGVGRGLANEFAKRGHNVVISSRKQDDIDQTVEEISALGGGKASGTVCDITQKSMLQNLWDYAVAAFGKADIWINNAGRAIGRRLAHELPENEIEIMVDGNLKGTIFASQVAITGFRKQGSGTLYNLLGGSYDAKRLVPGMSVYSSTKAGIYLFTEYLKDENKDQNILVGTISPGMLISDNWFNEQKQLSAREWESIKPTLNVLCDHVETATPWLVDEVLANKKHGHHISWLTGGKIAKRFFAAKVLGRKRDLFSRYGL